MNRVTIEIDDEVKRLEIGERLTSGSTYEVVVSGGAESVGEGELIFILPSEYERWLPREMREVTPVVAARASLTTEDGVTHGVMSTNTDVLAKISERMFGEVVTLQVGLHSTTHAENVAIGNVAVVLMQVVSGDPTGAAVLYRGEAGVGIETIVDFGSDERGNRIYKIVLTDGREEVIVSPRGERGDPGLDAAVGYIKCEDDKWHKIFGVTDSEGVCVLEIGGETRDDSPWDEFATRIKHLSDSAEQSAEIARESAKDASNAKSLALIYSANSLSSENNAKIYADRANDDANRADKFRKEAAESARIAKERADSTYLMIPLLTIIPFIYGGDEKWISLSDKRWLKKIDYPDAFDKLRALFYSGSISSVYPGALSLEGEGASEDEQLSDWHKEQATYTGRPGTWLSGLDFGESEIVSFEFVTKFYHDGSQSADLKPILFVEKSDDCGRVSCTVSHYTTNIYRIGLYVSSPGSATWNILNVTSAFQANLQKDHLYRIAIGFAGGKYYVNLHEILDELLVPVGSYVSTNASSVVLGHANIGGGEDSSLKANNSSVFLICDTTLDVNGVRHFDGRINQTMGYERSSFENGPDIVRYNGGYDVRGEDGLYFVLVDSGDDMGFKVPFRQRGKDAIGLTTEYVCRVK